MGLLQAFGLGQRVADKTRRPRGPSALMSKVATDPITTSGIAHKTRAT
jgi:hypothetical protein